jgi:HD superfamily phosphohydrolase
MLLARRSNGRMTNRRQAIIDPLYGEVAFGEELGELIRTPVIQRLRHLRLSNIDSVDMPAIANLSRFEHVVGVGHLAGEVGLAQSLNHFDQLVLRASGLLHDWSITSYGHLVEEALQYVGTGFDHEAKLYDILEGAGSDDIGGVDLQILHGRETGLTRWARRVVGQDARALLREIMNHIRGEGRMGRIISGGIDIDNIDNVFRMAFHMGLPIDRDTPTRLARSIVAVEEGAGRGPVFRANARSDIEAWIDVRRQLYQHLMLAERDFAGKVMILFAAVTAYEAQEITQDDWSIVDHEFMDRLLQSKVKEVKETAQRWAVGDLWSCTPLMWMSGDRPDYPSLLAFSRNVSRKSKRGPLFAYGIKDKRERRLAIKFEKSEPEAIGKSPQQWLLGIGSARREPFAMSEVRALLDEACRMFGCRVLGSAAARHAVPRDQACLL